MKWTFCALLSAEAASLMTLAAGMMLSYIGGFLLGCALSLLGGYRLRKRLPAALPYPIFCVSWMPLHVVALFRRRCIWKPWFTRESPPGCPRHCLCAEETAKMT